jgi:hypothetical protein
MPLFSLTPSEITSQNDPLIGAKMPNALPSNQVGGKFRPTRTFKKFMRGKKNYKKSVRKYLSSSSGMFSKVMRKIKGSSKKRR